MLPEDDANRQIADGFHLEVDWNRQRQMQVLPVAGGWNEVLNRFNADHVGAMEKYPDRFMALLIDFDGHENRLNQARDAIPQHLIDRVFILGAWTDPETLRAHLGSYETIGRAMARDCREQTNVTWGHDLLRHNTNELARLHERIGPIVFP